MNRNTAKYGIIFLADKASVTPVIRMHGHSRITDLGFKSRRRDRNREFMTVCKRDEFGSPLFVDDLIVGNRRLTLRVPIDDALTSVNEARSMHAHKRFHDCGVALFVHGVGTSRPVKRGAHLFKLIDDDAFIFFDENVDPAEKFFAPQIMPRFFLAFLYVLFNTCLRRDRSAVGPRDPKRSFALHTRRAHHNILNHDHKGASHVKNSRHVGRREHDGECLRIGFRDPLFHAHIRVGIPAFLPQLKHLRLL